ncbi:MAG: type II toxin-antitoxin system VapC family toxin [Acetobacteraceae bacterium]
MTFVLDASVTVAWALEDEESKEASAALALIRAGGASVPAVWYFEVRNTLLVNERRGRITQPATSAFLRELSSLPIVTDRAPKDAELLSLARLHRLTIYDAAYLELALREYASLATLDSALMRAARELAVPLVGIS